MDVLVTGGAGFIGSHLVDALSRPATRSGSSTTSRTVKRENVNPDAELLVGSLADPDAVTARSPAPSSSSTSARSARSPVRSRIR